jgi:hypothetical protein
MTGSFGFAKTRPAGQNILLQKVDSYASVLLALFSLVTVLALQRTHGSSSPAGSERSHLTDSCIKI